jgi:DNA-binding response OmpR family regulator
MNPMTNYAERLDEATETILQLKEAMQLEDLALYKGLRLTRNDGVILEMLLRTSGACGRSRLLNRLSLTSRSGTIYDATHLHMIIYRLRRKLTKSGIEIKAVRGIGFSMGAADKARLVALKQ